MASRTKEDPMELTEVHERVLHRLRSGPLPTAEAVGHVLAHPNRPSSSHFVPDLGVLHALWRRGLVAWD
jgi:hypothetical protein